MVYKNFDCQSHRFWLPHDRKQTRMKDKDDRIPKELADWSKEIIVIILYHFWIGLIKMFCCYVQSNDISKCSKVWWDYYDQLIKLLSNFSHFLTTVNLNVLTGSSINVFNAIIIVIRYHKTRDYTIC